MYTNSTQLQKLNEKWKPAAANKHKRTIQNEGKKRKRE